MAPAGVLNVAGLYLPILLLAWLYGPVVAGYVGFTQRVLGLPMTLIGQSVAQVYLGELSSVRASALWSRFLASSPPLPLPKPTCARKRKSSVICCKSFESSNHSHL